MTSVVWIHNIQNYDVIPRLKRIIKSQGEILYIPLYGVNERKTVVHISSIHDEQLKEIGQLLALGKRELVDLAKSSNQQLQIHSGGVTHSLRGEVMHVCW